ncbi:DUF305 domain-containing protein [Pseudonocardia asaccharolytica]|uniref:DUF305 domain-containing protein n=1 Tax=Pseudonocardia asaccharolytica DSM 44247 = NBRC 16224 TaxID=1123024 RepID=A0A511CXP6_9PSEU|nr:DUF305 domain-containing protein [Pseudonocardia asaccharolytica]GEL17329.1 hypothetical protein PA7_11660 [Pseudonocardia asaccharolytica DSM 44247 = NBRC 16224]
MKTTRITGLLAAAAAAAVLAGCGTSTVASGAAATAPLPSAAGPAEVSASHHDADVAFVQGMIPHHAQAVQMSRLAADHASSPQVTELASTIEAAQDPEIAQMQGLLRAWGLPAAPTTVTGDPAGANHGGAGHGGMSGMMTEDQMRQLGQARGPGFDRMFLQMMIEHHDGAVEMATTQLANGQNAEARALAQKIIDAQRAEIAAMRDLLATT